MLQELNYDIVAGAFIDWTLLICSTRKLGKFLRNWLNQLLIWSYDHWHFKASARRKVSMVIIRIHTHRIHKALAIWVELHVELKIQKSKIRRTVNLRKSKSIHRWMEAIFQDKRCEKLLLLWSRTTVAKAWKTWRIMVYENKFLRKCIRAKMHRKFYKSFRQWVIWFDDQKTNTAYVDAICGKLVANTRQTVKTLFIAWVHRHEYEKELCMIRDMSRKRRMLHLWRRILVVEKVFRQRAYRILPHAASHHESLMVRYVACAWRVWARHSRSLKVNLTRSVWRYFRRLIHKTLDVLTYNVEHAKKLLVPKVDIATVHYRQCRKLFVGRLLHLWLQEVRTCREEKLLENRVVAGVKHCEDSHFTATCGNIMRSWTVWTLSKKFFRSKEGMIQKLQIHKRRYLIRGDFHELVNNLRIEKRHRYITSRCNQAHRLRLRARAFANFHLFTAHRRILRSVLARKVRLYKSKLLRCWQQMGGVVNLEMTFDKQKIKAYRLCVKQRSKRGAMRFLHQWVMFLEQRRIWNKFYSRMARRRLSQMLHAWRTCLVSERVFVRAMQSCETKWLRNRLHEWRRNMDKSKLNHDVKIIYMREIQVRVVVRGWARITTKRKYKYELLNRVLKRRRRVLQQLVWKVWTGTEHKERLMKLAVQSMLHTVRTCFAYWRQGALLIPGISVSHTLDRLPHRSLLAFVLKQWRKYARKIKAAMFKIHPQFRLMKVWNSWQGRRRKLLTARCITDSIRSTVRALYLSSVMRQWLYAVTVPASDAEEAVRNKINRNVVNKFFLKLSEFIHWSKEVTKIAVAAGCTKVTKVAFNAFRGIVAHSIDMRAKSQCAIKQYELFLLADFFYDIRDDVLEGLLLDEGVQDIVKAKTYTTYLMVGFDAFYVLLEELRGFSSRAEGFRHQQDMVLNSDLLAEGFQALKDEYQSILSSNELIDKKYKDRNHAAFKLRTFGDFCCAVENQQRQYDEAEQSIRTKYFHSLKGEAFAVLFVEAQSEKEVEKTARIHFEINFKKRARHMVIYTLKHWITFSKKLEEVMFRKHEIFLMRGGFNELMWATQESVDPGLLKQMLRVRLHKNLKKTFSAFVARLKRRQLLYQVQAKVRQNVKKQSAKMHWCLWRDSFLTRKRRNLALRDIFYRRQCRLCRRALLEWCAVWWQQVYIGSKLVLLRKRFLLLHILTPAMMRWKQFRQNMARLLLAYFRILRTRTIRRATRMLWVWRSFIIDRTRTLRAIEGMMIRRRCNTFRKVLQVWHHSIDRRNQAGGISNSHNHALCRKLLQGWRSSCVEQQGVKERARTYFVIIKSLKIRSTRDLMCRGFIAFAENLFGSRSVASSFYRKVKWQHMRAAHSSLLQRAFVTWRRHWIEFEHLGEALRRVLSQRRSKVDLHHPFWAWVRYIEDKLNIRRETALVHKISKLLSDVLDVYGEPLVSDFSIRCERAYTIDDLIKLLKKFHQHHSDLKVSAKLQGAAPPRVVSYGPIPYSHYVTTIGKQSSNQMLHHPGLSPAPGLITPNLNQPEDLLNFPGFTGTLERKRSLKSDYTDYPPGVVIPEKYLGSSKEKHDNPKPASQSINRSLELSILKS